MRRMWWAQIKAVIRLELKKTFFARRGLWIYVLALLPVFLFIIYGIATATQGNRTTRYASRGDKTLTYQDLLAIKTGMRANEVTALLGKPALQMHWNAGPSGSILREHYEYSDGEHMLFVEIADGGVEGVHVNHARDLGEESIMFAGVFQFFFLRLAVFFGCLGIFMNLFRGEVLDRSLHFYFLAPIRREVLMAGKFLAGLLATGVIFVTSLLLQNLALVWELSPQVRDRYLFQNHGLEHAAIYVGVTVLACVGYGAFFMIAGMLFRNPLIPAAAILIWEAINPFLPNLLKQFSVIYYLKSLCPVDVPVQPGTPPLLALLVSNSDPVSPFIAVLGVLAVALVALYISSVQVRRMEINYTTE
jgi:ABC-type transport system involved in multi-copper enzyme maturation permease subunit